MPVGVFRIKANCQKTRGFLGYRGRAPKKGPGFGVLSSYSIDDLAVVALEERLERRKSPVTTTTRKDAARLQMARSRPNP